MLRGCTVTVPGYGEEGGWLGDLTALIQYDHMELELRHTLEGTRRTGRTHHAHLLQASLVDAFLQLFDAPPHVTFLCRRKVSLQHVLQRAQLLVVRARGVHAARKNTS